MAASSWKTVGKERHDGLQHPPLRLPGESADERLRELREQFLELVIVPLGLSLMAAFELWHWFTGLPIDPWAIPAMALVSIGYAVMKGWPLVTEIRRLRLGLDGERSVGHTLESLREQGYRVFHDIAGDGFNIDHAIVGPAGIFTIETKTRSKMGGAYRIAYDGNTLRVGEGQPFEDPLDQARAQARWLANLINEGRRTRVAVRPVVTFPEWYVERTARAAADVWVVNPKEIAGFLRNERLILSVEQIDAIAAVLTVYCRAAAQR
ncbi:MAG TPA: nuclease-related domain-containing protein [Nitrospira sp.]|nr:nuclease-related domain-containing protein [Nitrospira sp.]